MSNITNVSAAEVRAWGRENIASIPEGARACLGETARGRLHPEVTEAFRKAHKGRKGYTPKVAEGNTVTVPVTMLDKAGRKTTVKRTLATTEARRVLGHAEGKKGRLSKDTLSLALSAEVANEVADTFK